MAKWYHLWIFQIHICIDTTQLMVRIVSDINPFTSMSSCLYR